MHIPFQNEPHHLNIERIPVLRWHFGFRLDIVNFQLHGYVKAVQKIATKNQRVLASINSMNPARGQHERPALLQNNALTLVHNIGQECVGLLAGQDPLFVLFQIGLGGRYEPENLLALEQMIPDGGAAHVDVEIGVAAGHAHQYVLLHLGVLHFVDEVGGLGVGFAEMRRPGGLDPVELAHDQGRLDVVLQLRVAELEADDVEESGALLLLVVLAPVFHAHREAFLGFDVDYVYDAFAAHAGFDVANFEVLAGYAHAEAALVFEDERGLEAVLLDVFVIEL